MSGIYGVLGLPDTDRSYVNTIGQRVVFDAVNEYMRMVNEDMAAARSVFIEGTTTDFKERYKLPGGGRMQRRRDQVRSGAVKAYGAWDVAYPLEDFGDSLVETRKALAYMTLPELNRHLETIRNRAMNTLRWEILHALLDDEAGSSRTFIDEIHGSLTVVPLANGDAVVYPPVLGSESEAVEDHYSESGYAAASISDTNDPIKTLINELEEHFGDVTGGSNIVVFINDAQRTQIEDLTDFTPVPDNFLRVGDNVDVPEMLPMVPGKILGRHDHGAWISQWRWMPENYLYAQHLEAPAPLKMRVPPADTGLPGELTLVSTSDQYPLQFADYEWDFGVAVGNRLNGAVMELGTGGGYTVPTNYD